MTHFLETYAQVCAFLLVLSPVIALLLGIYLAPVIVARRRGHPNAAPILVIDLLLGWTVLGWVLSLAWAVSALEGKPVWAYKDEGRQPLRAKFIKWAIRFILLLVAVAVPIAAWKSAVG